MAINYKDIEEMNKPFLESASELVPGLKAAMEQGRVKSVTIWIDTNELPQISVEYGT